MMVSSIKPWMKYLVMSQASFERKCFALKYAAMSIKVPQKKECGEPF